MPELGFGDLAERLRRSTVQVLQGGHERGSGSGVIWDTDGLIVTNAHVASSGTARVELWDGRAFEGRVATSDPRRDLATLRIPTRGLPAAAAGDSSTLRAGELVMAVGNPLGFIGALTTGVVHGFGPLRGLGRRNWVQAAVRLAPGNSGGPLANAQGRVIGINTMVARGLALAVPSNVVRDFVNRGVSGVSLGVTVRPVQIGRGGEAGWLVLEVAENGPAGAASLLMGDVLIGANGKAFGSLDDLGDALESAPGGVLSLQFQRGGRNLRREVTVRLAAQGIAA